MLLFDERMAHSNDPLKLDREEEGREENARKKSSAIFDKSGEVKGEKAPSNLSCSILHLICATALKVSQNRDELST